MLPVVCTYTNGRDVILFSCVTTPLLHPVIVDTYTISSYSSDVVHVNFDIIFQIVTDVIAPTLKLTTLCVSLLPSTSSVSDGPRTSTTFRKYNCSSPVSFLQCIDNELQVVL